MGYRFKGHDTANRLGCQINGMARQWRTSPTTSPTIKPRLQAAIYNGCTLKQTDTVNIKASRPEFWPRSRSRGFGFV